MSSVNHRPRGARRLNAGQWAAGAFKALAAIGLSALVVWAAVAAVRDAGLLAPFAPEPPSPTGGGPFADRGYG